MLQPKPRGPLLVLLVYRSEISGAMPRPGGASIGMTYVALPRSETEKVPGIAPTLAPGGAVGMVIGRLEPSGSSTEMGGVSVTDTHLPAPLQ